MTHAREDAHVSQRGNRRRRVLPGDDDCRFHVERSGATGQAARALSLVERRAHPGIADDGLVEPRAPGPSDPGQAPISRRGTAGITARRAARARPRQPAAGHRPLGRRYRAARGPRAGTCQARAQAEGDGESGRKLNESGGPEKRGTQSGFPSFSPTFLVRLGD